MDDNLPIFEVSDAITVINQSLEYAYPTICVVGEVSGFKVNQGKWVFFDIKDDGGTLGCFMSVFNLRIQIEDGMKVMVIASPKLTQRGRFSLTVQHIKPVGEGSLKKAYELLRTKLDKEGLFAQERKRQLPYLPKHIGVISSTDAAGYKDFIKILSERFGGIKVEVFHTLVQGLDAPEQIMQGIDYFNESETPPEVILLLRGGGSADDLAAFNDEPLVRKVASSRVPTLTGIGHEVDMSLVDLAADVRASTPSNAAEILVPDKREILNTVFEQRRSLMSGFVSRLDAKKLEIENSKEHMKQKTASIYATIAAQFRGLELLLESLNPWVILKRGYGIIRNEKGQLAQDIRVGELLNVETYDRIIKAEVRNVTKK